MDKILTKSFIMTVMIVLALSWSAKLSFADNLREDATHHIEHAIDALESGHLRQAFKHVMNAAHSTRRFNRRISHKLKRIARKIRRRHRRHHYDIIEDLEEIKRDLDYDDDHYHYHYYD